MFRGSEKKERRILFCLQPLLFVFICISQSMNEKLSW